MKRNEVETKYKWDLESIYATDEKWEQDFAKASALVGNIEAYKGKLSDKAELLKCLKCIDETEMVLYKLFNYAHMRKDENTANDFYGAMTDRCFQLFSTFGAKCAFVEPELSALSDEFLSSLVSDADFSDYDYKISEIIRGKKYILSEKEERILALSSIPMGAFEDIFAKADNVDIPLGYITVDGKREKLTHGKYAYYLDHPDQKVRKKAFDAYYLAYKKILNILGATYAGSVKSDNFIAKVRGFDNSMQMAMYNENVPAIVYENLLKSINKALPTLHRYMALRKKLLNLKTMNMYDMFVSFVETDIKVDYDTAFEMVKEGLAPLGEDYVALLQKSKDERWIDVFETENKRSGAYSSGCYGTKPFVLLNYSYTAHDVFTIAHELGHSIHSYYSRERQPFAKSRYEIFVAEVASTVNEVLLLKHLINNTQDKQFKKYLLAYYLNMFRTTVFRQTMFAEFEYLAHEKDANGEALTPAMLSDEYYKLNKKYYGEAVNHNEQIAFEWARIPHFYSAFYVYKYATGLTSAVAIARNVLQNPAYVEKYKKFLSSGSSASPYDILCLAGVDLATSEPFEEAMKEFEDTLKQLEELNEEN